MALSFVQRVKEFITGKKDIKTGVRLVINCEKLENRVALLDSGALEEYTVERTGTSTIVGSIFKGKVKNIEHGLKAMFIDIGLDKNAFLHFWDAIPEALSNQGMEEVSRSGAGKQKQKRIKAEDIPQIYPVGSEIMVQVTKGPIGNKGPRVTTNISLAGRLLVLMPQNDQFGISRKIEDPKERARLRKIIERVNLPDGLGLIMRTEAAGKRARHIIRDLSLLIEQWNEIIGRRDSKAAPVCCFQEPELIERTVRDFLTEDIDAVYVDDPKAMERMQHLVGQISKRSRSRVQLYRGQEHIFDAFGVHKQIEEAFRRQVWLPCGGYIVIDETEALIAIDVNTGRNKGSKDMEKTILQTNLEAADEIARQLRLRNIGGIIIGDFIDMKSRRDQQAVYQRVKERLKRDKARTHVLPISSLGLMEMTRQRAAESLSSSHYVVCPHCQGKGVVKSPMSMSVELQRALHSVMRKHQENVHELRIVVPPSLLDRLRNEDEELLIDIERRYQGRLTFRSDPLMHPEKFLIQNGKTGDVLSE